MTRSARPSGSARPVAAVAGPGRTRKAAPHYAPRPEYIKNLSVGPRQHPAMFYFAGSGPPGTTCATCAAFLPATDENRGRCSRWVIHRGRGNSLTSRGANPNWWRGLPCIAAVSQSCKYWLEPEP